MKLFAFTIDLEAEYSGCIKNQDIFNDTVDIEKILSLLDSFGVKITVFVVSRLFQEQRSIIRLFEKYNCEFQVHSHSHDIADTNSESEIKRSKLAYFDYFKKCPVGYRVPQGRLSGDIISSLKKHGFLFDSSIIPSYYPNPLRYLFRNRNIGYIGDSHILEIPITSISPFRLALTLSYIKLLGINFYLRLFRLFGLPEVICFASHLHDFIVKEGSYNNLSWFWKFIYGRNKYSGIDFCKIFLEYVKERNYDFCYLSEIYNDYRQGKLTG